MELVCLAAAAPALATSPPVNGLRPYRTERYRIFTARKAFSRRAPIKAILDQSFGARVSDRLKYRNTAIFSSGTKVIGARLFRAFGWITVIPPAARLNPSRVTDRAPSLPQGIMPG